jgi:hypothetical protein
VTVLDTSLPLAGRPECRHDVVVPANGFRVPIFDVPFLNGGSCSAVTPLPCESGTGEGAGALWDGAGDAGLARTDVAKVGDTSDGTCNPAGQLCGITGAGANTLGDVDVTRTPSASAGIRSTLDLHVRSITWTDESCNPVASPGCCASAVFGDDVLDELITEFDVVLTPTTDRATGAFVDKNGDGCKFAGRGFDVPQDGPVTATGIPAPGPCCAVGQSTTVVAVGIAFSGGEPLNDLGFRIVMPNLVTSCGAPSPATCTVSTDSCLQ